MGRPSARGLAAVLTIAGLGTAVGATAVSARSRRANSNIIPVDQIRPGMKGYAVTVFHGDQTDRFAIEVVDVVHNYLPKQDAVLFTSPDPRLKHSGIVGGMSGSPIYIGGKLAGALAYGYRFNKDPIGGLTPIANMLEVADLPFRPGVLPTRRIATRAGASAWADSMLGLNKSPLPERRRPTLTDAVGLAPLGVPMSVSGLGPTAMSMLADQFGMIPTRGGSAGTNSARKPKPKRWKPGDSMSVLLVAGENSVAPNGTITWVGPKGKKLLGFGHPMFGDGPSNLPFSDARIHTIIPSVERSVKISSPLQLRGVMYQDRQPAIAMRTDLTAKMIPVVTTLDAADPDVPSREYRNHVALGVDITPNLLAILVSDAAEEGGRDATEVVLELVHEYDVTTSGGSRTVRIVEEAFFPSGLAPRLLGRSQGILVSAALLDNQFEVANIRAVRQNTKITYSAPIEAIEDVRVPSGEIRAGDVLRLQVKWRAYKGEARWETVPVRVPDDAGHENIQVEITGGDYARPYRPIPASLDNLLDTIEHNYPSRSLVVSIYRQAEGLSTRHGLVHDVPDSVLESLAQRGNSQDTVRLKQMARRVLPQKNIVKGKHTLKLKVLPRKKL